jgi:ketosteroid isomerase-like protein
MYRKIVAGKTRTVWLRINERDVDAPWAMAADDLHFTFVGATELGASFVGRDQFREWLRAVFERFPDISFAVRDVVVTGWPWNTRVAVRLGIAATLADGTYYENEAVQWVTLRWGRMIEDWVIEDTVALADALRRQPALASTAP